MPVTEAGLDLWRPAVAVDGRGDVVVIWAQQVEGNWDLYRRTYTPAKGDAAGRWSEIVRITDDPGTDAHAVATTDSKGTVWVAWQACATTITRSSPRRWRRAPGRVRSRRAPPTTGARRSPPIARAACSSPGIRTTRQLRRPPPRRGRGEPDDRGRHVEPVRGPAVARLRRRRPCLDCLRAGGRELGQGLRQRDAREDPGPPGRVPALPRPDGPGEMPGRRRDAETGPGLARGRPPRRPAPRQELPASGRR